MTEEGDMITTLPLILLASVLVAVAASAVAWDQRRGRGRRILLEQALDAIPVAAQVILDRRQVVFANTACHDLFANAMVPLPELLGQQVVGEAASAEIDRLVNTPEGGQAELAVATDLGEIAWREVVVRPLPKLSGHALWFCRVVTADRRANAVFRPLVQALEGPAENGDLAANAHRLEAQLAQTLRLQAVGQLAGGIAHDFNNLLTAMIGFCDLLLLRHRPGDQSFADVMQIRQNANRAAGLVRQLLAYSRQQTLQPRVISLSEVLAELAHLLRRLIGTNIDLKFEHGRDLYPVLADQGQLEQVVINLAVNARDAMPEGGALTIRTANLTLGESLSGAGEHVPAGDYVRIEVSDTGIGISPEIIDRIFEPFFSTKPVGAGTGLGLATVYGIVKQSGGYVAIESALGKGTTFSLYLPRHTERVVSLVRREGEDEARDLTGAGTILLVEDEDAVRLFGARALRNKGYKVIEARSGRAALDIIAQSIEPIDLLITDVVMPEIDGPTLAREVRSRRPDLRVIFISGYAESAFRSQVDGNSMNFLAKPFSLKQLTGKVKDVMQGVGEDVRVVAGREGCG
jgi:signal transduction histidine kinase/CheY-like chemotaxis protein